MFLSDLQRWQEKLEALPPEPRIVVHAECPPGTIWRMWDTEGRPVVYMARDVLNALPRRHLAPPAALTGVFGIPVVSEG